MKLWDEEYAFNAKRPFGGKDWTIDLCVPLIEAGLLNGTISSNRNIEDIDYEHAKQLIRDAIIDLFDQHADMKKAAPQGASS